MPTAAPFLVTTESIPNIAKCPLGSKVTPTESHCSEETNKIISVLQSFNKFSLSLCWELSTILGTEHAKRKPDNQIPTCSFSEEEVTPQRAEIHTAKVLSWIMLKNLFLSHNPGMCFLSTKTEPLAAPGKGGHLPHPQVPY